MSDYTPHPSLEKGKAYCGLSLPAGFYFTPDSFIKVPPEESARRRKECAAREAQGLPEHIKAMLAKSGVR